jgi:hypothetical protein
MSIAVRKQRSASATLSEVLQHQQFAFDSMKFSANYMLDTSAVKKMGWVTDPLPNTAALPAKTP